MAALLTDAQVLDQVRAAASIGQWVKADDLFTAIEKKSEKYPVSALHAALDRLVAAGHVESQNRYDGPIIKRYVCLRPSEVPHEPSPAALDGAFKNLGDERF